MRPGPASNSVPLQLLAEVHPRPPAGITEHCLLETLFKGKKAAQMRGSLNTGTLPGHLLQETHAKTSDTLARSNLAVS